MLHRFVNAEESQPLPSADRTRARRASAGLGPALGLGASLLAMGLACRELLRFQPETRMVVSPARNVEEFFFEPSDSSPLLVLIFCGWLAWRRRKRLARLWGARGPWVGTAVLWGVATALFAWSVRFGAPELQALALVPALLGAGHAMGGPAAVRVLALPAAALLFAVPVPAPLMNQIVWDLQIFAADFTGFALGLVGLPAVVSGDRIFLSGSVFAIIETCSGVRSIETLGMLAVMLVDLFGRRGWHAGVLLLAAPPLALLVNGFRCVGLVFNPYADISSIHSLQGIAMLLGGVLLLYLLDGVLEGRLPSPRPGSAAERRARAAGVPRDPLGPRVLAVVGLAAVWLAISFAPRFPAEVPSPLAPAHIFARELGGWTAVDDLRNDWLFLGKTRFRGTLHRRYARGGESVDVFIGQADLGDRMRSYHSPKAAFPGSGWIREDRETVRLAGREATLLHLRKGASRVLAAHWFEASPGVAAESLRALLALDAVPFPRTRVPAAVRLATPLGSGPEARARAIDRLDRFATLVSPGLLEATRP